MSPSSVRVRLVSLYASRFDQWTAHLGLTRYAVAKAMGNPGAQEQLRKWSRDEHDPQTKSVRRVVDALGITEAEFWAGPPEAARPPSGEERPSPLVLPADPPDLASRRLRGGERRRTPDRRRRAG